MIALAQLVSWVALIGTILPAVLFFADRVTLDQTKLWMLIATIVWFVAAPFWMREER